MRDYAEQVRELRDFAEEFDLEDHVETAAMLANAADAIEELTAENAALKDDVDLCSEENTALYSAIPKWNPASTPPIESGRYIVCCYDGHQYRVSFANYQHSYGRWDLTGARSYWRVTHWTPMPEPPAVAPPMEETK